MERKLINPINNTTKYFLFIVKFNKLLVPIFYTSFTEICKILIFCCIIKEIIKFFYYDEYRELSTLSQS